LRRKRNEETKNQQGRMRKEKEMNCDFCIYKQKAKEFEKKEKKDEEPRDEMDWLLIWP
jgi:hypothetical protein